LAWRIAPARASWWVSRAQRPRMRPGIKIIKVGREWEKFGKGIECTQNGFQWWGALGKIQADTRRT
jgi:hypothetical protein